MCLDIETLPQGAHQSRAMLRAGDEAGERARLSGIEARAKAAGALPTPPERRPIRPGLRDPAVIKRHQMERESEYQAAVADYAQTRAAAALSWWRQGSTLASRGEVACVGYSIPGTDEVCVTDLEERAALVELQAAIEAERPDVLMAWNAPFDAGFIGQRAHVLGLSQLAGWMSCPRWPLTRDLGIREAGPKVVDACDLWPVAGRRPGKGERKFATACLVLGIDHAVDNPIDGSQVLDAFLEWRDDDILAHCRADVRDLVAVAGRLLEPYGLRVGA